MNLLGLLRRLVCREDGATRPELDEKVDRREREITRTQQRLGRLERMLDAEQDLFKRGRK